MTHDMKPGEPSEKEQRDEALDEALEETFPTSDPIQLSAHLEGAPSPGSVKS